MVRINRYLAQCGLGSRRQVEKLILAGEIKINGKKVEDLSIQIDPVHDQVQYQAHIIQPDRKKIYIMLNKPVDYIVSTRDDFSRKTIYELLPSLATHCFPVGRLDLNSEGLLLLTNDGDFANSMLHPRFKISKLYKVIVKGEINQEQLQKLRSGITLGGIMTQPARVHIKTRSTGKTVLRMSIQEGRKRQIREMFRAVGSQVMSLRRLQIGNLKLGDLPAGRWRYLTKEEVHKLKRQAEGENQ
ncbi:MAG: rRNA pseudouridine synthase [Candidatus Cloacimonetes bacterium]|nr:rRNA pseudouridine synthase [Candidatus Cloacimonadota bacterium]